MNRKICASGKRGCLPSIQFVTRYATTSSAAGRAQAVALPFGKGRVVVTGEAAMLTAQNQNFGMNYPGTDDRQFALNIMHWLTGLLK